MADFTLLNYNSIISSNGLREVNNLKRNYKDVLSNSTLMLNLEGFILNSRKIQIDYLNKLKEIYEIDEEFHFLVPVSSCDYFVNKIKEWISNEFGNAIDISDLFSERAEIDMARNGKDLKQKLKENIIIEDKIKDYKITKIFIGDDVYNTGTSVEVYTELIKEKLNYEIEFSFGTLIKTQ